MQYTAHRASTKNRNLCRRNAPGMSLMPMDTARPDFLAHMSAPQAISVISTAAAICPVRVKPRGKAISAGSHCMETLPSTLPSRTLGPAVSRGNITADRHRPHIWKKHRKTTAAMPPVNEPYKYTHPSKPIGYILSFSGEKVKLPFPLICDKIRKTPFGGNRVWGALSAGTR